MIEDFELDIPFASKYVATVIGHTLTWENSLPMNFLEHALDHLIPSKKASIFVANIFKTMVKEKVR
jgi:hypothetical protein